MISTAVSILQNQPIVHRAIARAQAKGGVNRVCLVQLQEKKCGGGDLVTYCFGGPKGVLKLDVWSLNVARLAIGAGLGSDDGDSPDNDGGAFGDQAFIICVFFFGLSVSDLQVAVRGSQLLPARDLPLQVLQRDVRAVKNHRVVAKFRGKFIMNMSHDGEAKSLEDRPLTLLPALTKEAMSWELLWKYKS